MQLTASGLRCKMLLGDLNQDGQMEILMVQANGDIDDRYVPHQNGRTGELKQSFELPDPEQRRAG